MGKTAFALLLVCAFVLINSNAFAQPPNDNYANATDVTALINSCSADAAYTTLAATGDRSTGSCWDNGGPLFNVWFKFTAPASGQINTTIQITGTKGTQRYTELALWQANGTTQVACNRYVGGTENVTVGATALTPGNTYYISVDVVNSAQRGTFTLCLSSAVDYDFYEGATDVTSLINSCSADAAYTTIGATADKNIGTCWDNGGPLYNRWFKFTAPASGMINATIQITGTKGTQRYTELALWQANGTTQIACNRYVGGTESVVVGATALTPGNTYYISVDVVNSAQRGTFTLCLSSTLDYDFYEGATDVTSLINSCSADAAYTTIGATADKNIASCWDNGGPLYNRWFKFTAPASGMINATIQITGTKGTQRYTELALWQANGTTQIACNRYVGGTESVVVGATTLTPGNTYYLSVDVVNNAQRGTFTLCLSSTVDYDFYDGAIDVTSLINSCSADATYTTIGATADKNIASCWDNGGPLYNRWFKFTAPASGMINATIQITGTKGTQRYTELALWQANGTTQVACNRYVGGTESVVVGATALTPGNTYYLSVDVVNNAQRGTFTLCLSSTLDYDFYEGATDVTSLINSCSADAAYTTIGATADKNIASCWDNGGPLYNRWFKFTAPASGMINATIQITGTKGTQRYTELALWQANGTTQVACNRYVGGTESVVVGATALTPGNTYYLSVDVVNNAQRGTFTLCLSSTVDYDFYDGAIDVTGIINSCSADAAYTTIGATADKNIASCWDNGGPLYNRWFKFTAPASGMINATIQITGTKGTQRYTELALWQANGTTQVACNRYVGGTEDVSVGATNLITGNTYYLSVDVVNSAQRGTFTLCLSSTADYDFYGGAIDVTGIINSCSADAAYTTIGATADKNIASCWDNGGPLYNRWFKFTAPASGMINATIQITGTKGTQRYTELALWQANGTTQVACNRYVGGTEDVSVGAAGLTPGATYYLSVDVVNSAQRGTFTLCLSSTADYDFYEGAVELTDLNNWCSATAAYTTVGATADKGRGSCWDNGGPLYNRWFKFQAITSNVTIIVNVGGAQTQRYTELALWQANGTTQVACNRYSASNTNVSLTNSSLVVGNWYYISVDVVNSAQRGTFSLCVNNIGTTYYSRASNVWNVSSTWSTAGYGGAAASSYPNNGDVANIQGYDITVPSNQQAAEVYIDATVANTSLTINSGISLAVNGKMTLNQSASAFSGAVSLSNNSSLSVNDKLIFNRSGGSGAAFGMTLSNGSTLTINKDLNWTSSAGTVSSNLLTVNGNAAVTVNQDINLNSTGGQLIKLQFNNTSSLTVNRDINFTATAASLEAIELNNSAQLNIGRSFVRGATPYGALTSNNTSSVNYNGTVYPQVFASSTGSGADAFLYQNVTINNTRTSTPQITMGGPATVNGTLTLTSGVISSTSTNILNLKNTSSTTIGSTSSYIDGPMTYEVATATANTIRNFPIGNNGAYRPAVLTVTHSGAGSVIYTAQHFFSSAAALGYTLPPTIDRVSGVRYWQINSSDLSTLTTARVTLYYGYGTTDGVTDLPNLVVAKTAGAGTTWNNAGRTSATAEPGNILSASFTSTFGTFTLANTTSGGNPLPIELTSFEGSKTPQGVLLKWITASELNNDHFVVEKSTDGAEFIAIFEVKGSGTTKETTHYHATDDSPVNGINYYRLKQVDTDGRSAFSKVISVHSDSERIMVYPNPTRGEPIRIQAASIKEGSIVEIINNTGVIVFTRKWKDLEVINQVSTIYDSQTLPAGLYLIRISGGNKLFSFKIVISD